MSMQEKLDRALDSCANLPNKRIMMSPEAYVALRNELFVNSGTVITDTYETFHIDVNLNMIGLKDYYIDTSK